MPRIPPAVESVGFSKNLGASMARAGLASASAHADSIKGSDSIKGLAQSIARPAYRRLLLAEPALRRAVPVLIIAFLATICVGAMVQVLDQRKQTIDTMGLCRKSS